jgi:hypothetical protein
LFIGMLIPAIRAIAAYRPVMPREKTRQFTEKWIEMRCAQTFPRVASDPLNISFGDLLKADTRYPCRCLWRWSEQMT